MMVLNSTAPASHVDVHSTGRNTGAASGTESQTTHNETDENENATTHVKNGSPMDNQCISFPPLSMENLHSDSMNSSTAIHTKALNNSTVEKITNQQLQYKYQEKDISSSSSSSKNEKPTTSKSKTNSPKTNNNDSYISSASSSDTSDDPEAAPEAQSLEVPSLVTDGTGDETALNADIQGTRQKSKAQKPKKSQKDVEKGEEEGERDEGLKQRILSLEKQLETMSDQMSQLLTKMEQDHRKATSTSINDSSRRNRLRSSPDSSLCSRRSSGSAFSPPVSPSTPFKPVLLLNSSNDTTSGADATTTDTSNNKEEDENGTTGMIEASPALEYRSYTPNYEQELKNLRKNSRTQSIDISEQQQQQQSHSGHNTNNVNSVSCSTIATISGEELAQRMKNGLNQTNDKKGKNTIQQNGGREVSNTITIDHKNLTKVVKSPSRQSNVKSTGKAQNDTLLPPKSSKEMTNATNVTQKQSTVVLSSSPKRKKSDLNSANRNSTTVSTTSATVAATTATIETPTTKGIFDFLKSLNLDSLQQDGSAMEDVDVTMEEFLRVPLKLERLMIFGLLICSDAFLHVMTVVPLKFIWSCICFLCTLARPGKGISGCQFHRRHWYQVIRVFVICFVYKYCLCPISIGKLYHWIRGQAMLKLYVLMAMVEVFDRLMCSFGQDALDSLYWNTTRRPYHPRMVVSTLVVLVYAMVHSIILLIHVATLNVAMNSSDHALISLLIGGNFAEIKSTVFKKYNKQNLFKITTSDICERFKLILFLGMVLLLNCCQGGMNQEMVNDYIYMASLIIFAEMLCDWIKHSFITKFNFIKSGAYPDYAMILAGDVNGIGHNGLNIDHTHAVVKRLGFAQLPLTCVLARYLSEAARFANMLGGDGDSDHVLYPIAAVYSTGSWIQITNILLAGFVFLLFLKIVLGELITKTAHSIIVDGGKDDDSVDNGIPDVPEKKDGNKPVQRRQAV